MMIVTGKQISLPQLATELAHAAVVVNGLALSGPSADDPSVDLHTFDLAGEALELPPAAGPVVAAHVPQAPAATAQQQAGQALSADPTLSLATRQNIATVLGLPVPAS